MPKDFFTDPRFAPVQDALRVYLAKMLHLSGVGRDEARARGAAVYRYGKALAEVQWAPEELRDPERNYHSMTIEALESDIPDVPWKKMLDVLGAPDERRVIVGQPGPIADGVAVAMRTDIRVLRDATRIDLLDRYAEVLPTPFGEAGFALEQVLGGAQERPPLWKRGLWHVSGTAGDALGRLYVERHFPASSKAAVERMVGDIRAAFRERLASADWMDEPTRAEALAKLDALNVKIGYPDHRQDEAASKIEPGDALGNLHRARVHDDREAAANLGRPVDRDEWYMLPPETNAYYAPSLNEIVFPAGILEPPFYDPEAGRATNYGAIGTVIGHEITHAFDDQGRAFDETGRLRDWWTASASRRFSERAEALGEQYASYSPLPGMFVNPALTMGENIADLGGLDVAHAAYRLAARASDSTTADDHAADRHFFLAYARMWRGKTRDEAVALGIESDPHAPNRFRVDGVVRNLDTWYEAFAVEPGDALFLPKHERVVIW